jgi:formylglycine-generating enzyme required for sulfatase activity
VVDPLQPKPAEPEREKPPPSSSGGTGGKRPSKQVIAYLVIAAVLVAGGLIYLAFRASQSPSPQPAPIAAMTPSPPVIATPTVEAKAPPTPEVTVQPSAQPTAPVAVAIPSPSISATPSKEELARRALDNAAKDHPWVNSLGMKFVPVAGTDALFSVWDTRVQDFETFVKSTGYDAGEDWKNPGFEQGPTYPVVNVSWEDARAFCEWLTKTEQASGRLPNGSLYRLPTDQEWSVAVGLPSEPGNTPEEKDGKIKVYPWGTQWPPPNGAGNYSGEERTSDPIYGYKDDYVHTSPVGSFAANQFGLYDMGGNVWQWCEDRYNNAQVQYVLRGASWNIYYPDGLLASYRFRSTPGRRNDDFGFRCVVAVESSR